MENVLFHFPAGSVGNHKDVTTADPLPYLAAMPEFASRKLSPLFSIALEGQSIVLHLCPVFTFPAEGEGVAASDSVGVHVPAGTISLSIVGDDSRTSTMWTGTRSELVSALSSGVISALDMLGEMEDG